MVCFKLVVEVVKPFFLDLAGLVIVLTGRVLKFIITLVKIAPCAHYVQDGEE